MTWFVHAFTVCTLAFGEICAASAISQSSSSLGSSLAEGQAALEFCTLSFHLKSFFRGIPEGVYCQGKDCSESQGAFWIVCAVFRL